jgi:hypothetical protein
MDRCPLTSTAISVPTAADITAAYIKRDLAKAQSAGEKAFHPESMVQELMRIWLRDLHHHGNGRVQWMKPFTFKMRYHCEGCS